MKLYYTPGACSLSPHIVLRELGTPFVLVKVDGRTKRLPDGGSYDAVVTKGYVPCLELEGGERITEGPAIVQYLADTRPEANLAPAAGTLARVRVQEWLNFVTSELHKSFSPLFSRDTPESYLPIARAKVLSRFEIVEAALADRSFLTGDTFTVADAYLFVVAGFAKHVAVDLSRFARLNAYLARIGARPAVVAAMRAEGLS